MCTKAVTARYYLTTAVQEMKGEREHAVGEGVAWEFSRK